MPKPRRFKRRVAVYRGAEDVFYAAPAAAAHLLDAGLATVRQKSAKVIGEILLGGAADGSACGRIDISRLELRPGSFGIRREHLEVSGHLCFSHRRSWDEVIRAEATACSGNE
jgi:hypothetical protein